MDSLPLMDRYTLFDALVRRVFHIEDITLGTSRDEFLVRYRGHLLDSDSAAAYDRLAESLRPQAVTPLFRWDGDRHVILLTPSQAVPTPSNPRINLILFILTLLSVLLTGGLYGLQGALPAEWLPALLVFIRNGWPFALSMILILGAHELGHYFAGRYHGAHVTVPYFIPFPFSPFGTLGAFINMKDHPKNRRALLDIGIAGPLAGLVVALPVLYIGLKLSSVSALPVSIPADGAMQMEGNSLLYLLFKYLAFGQLLPAPPSYEGLSPVLYWLRYFFTARPFPYGGTDVMLSGVAWAGWAGLLVTGLNLIPAGQLDGGHMIYVLFGKKVAQRLRPVILVFLALMGFVWSGWFLWFAIIFFLGRSYAEPLDQITPLDPRRKALAILALVIFVLTFTPVPLSVLTPPLLP